MAIIVNCHNYGKIEGSSGVAGIVGQTGGEVEKVFVKECNNYGEVVSNHKNAEPEKFESVISEIAGIVQNNNGYVIECINFGDIKGVVSAGGIISSNGGIVNKCINHGRITTSIGSSNGVSRPGVYDLVSVGIVVYNYGEINNCYSTGLISSEVRDGLNISPKVIGLVHINNGCITNCYTISQLNTAKIVNIINTNNGTINNCYYLNSTYTGNVLNNVISKDSDFMKTEDFINLLNNGNDVFVLDSENKNDGYPVFNDEKDEIVISLKDENLYNCLIDSIGIFIFKNNEESLEISILEEDIGYITELDLSEKEIINITGLENFTSLTDLCLKENNVMDISCLENLKELETLDLSFNKITDITPLKELEGIERLDLKYNNVKEIPILSCKNLKYLNLETNNLTDITNISNLKNLEEAYFSNVIQGEIKEGNKIENIEVVKELNNLKKFGISGNVVSDVSVLEEVDDISGYSLKGQDLIASGEIGEEISLPKIFVQAQDKNSRAYSEKGIRLYNCKLNEDGTKIILTLEHASSLKEARVEINDGILAYSEFTVNVTEKDESSPILKVDYSEKNLTKDNVLITITANEEIQEVEGWELTEDKKILTKEYSANTRETITIRDLAGNETEASIEINNIDKVAPNIQVEYSTKEITRDNVLVTITVNEEIQEVKDWTLSSDRRKLTKEYSENIKEAVVVKDLAGNEAEANIEITNIKSVIVGDLNGDGNVTLVDLSLLRKHYLGVETLQGDALVAGDMNNDDQISLVDISIMRKTILGMDV